MSSKEFPGLIAVLAIIEKDGKFLLHKRKNTSFYEGWYSLVGGKLEGSESQTQGIIREVKEEIGVTVMPEDVEFVHTKHVAPEVTGTEYFYNYFRIKKWEGEPFVAEPDHCEEIEWFDLKNLPEQFVPIVKDAFLLSLNGTYYSEYGWKA